MSTWWEKQEGLKELAKQFEEEQNGYIMGDMKKRHAPAPPMSPFDSNQKDSGVKKDS